MKRSAGRDEFKSNWLGRAALGHHTTRPPGAQHDTLETAAHRSRRDGEAQAAEGLDVDPPMRPEAASALAVRAACADLESWAVRATTPEGCVGPNDLIRILDALRDTTNGVDV